MNGLDRKYFCIHTHQHAVTKEKRHDVGRRVRGQKVWWKEAGGKKEGGRVNLNVHIWPVRFRHNRTNLQNFYDLTFFQELKMNPPGGVRGTRHSSCRSCVVLLHFVQTKTVAQSRLVMYATKKKKRSKLLRKEVTRKMESIQRNNACSNLTLVKSKPRTA